MCVVINNQCSTTRSLDCFLIDRIKVISIKRYMRERLTPQKRRHSLKVRRVRMGFFQGKKVDASGLDLLPQGAALCIAEELSVTAVGLPSLSKGQTAH